MTSRRELANAIRALSMDAVQKANSGHPGAPMGMADMAEVLWNDFLTHNPANPNWYDRDRFVLSNGHGSMLIYSLLHLSGYDLGIEELKQFRQMGSKTPGHPEYGYAPGVETTTGPLGQGITNAVGMAIAEKALAGQFNRDGHNIVDHNTYVFLGDGCLMEGVSSEASSLAGTLGLGKLIALYDANNITIDGNIDGWFDEDVGKRYEAYGWHVVYGVDGHDADSIKAAVAEAKAETDKPSLVICTTTIGFGSPNKGGKSACHGSPLGDDEIALVRKELGWAHAPFVVPDEIYAGWDGKAKGAAAEKEWDGRYAAYKAAYPELAAEFERRMEGELPANWAELSNGYINATNEAAENLATRQASQKSIAAFGEMLPELMGGCADLACSNLAMYEGSKPLSREVSDGNYVHFGVREFAMSAAMNGIALHGGFTPYGATFLMFSEYARNALRMAALMKIRCLFVYTHDSIGLGEDGPTHQAVEQTATLRMIPNMSVWRPCDTVESAVAWTAALERKDGPSCMMFSRQGLPHQDRSAEQIAAIRKGGYVLADCDGTPDAIIIATGSEIGIAQDAAKALTAKGRKVRVVSMPNTNIFDQQDAAYRETVLPAAVRARVSVEAGVTSGWRKYVGLDGRVVGIDTFGESAPPEELFKHFGFTAENVISKVEETLG